MSEELFNVPVQLPDRLTRARIEFARAEKALEEAEAADELFDGFGIVPDAIKRAMHRARVELQLAEQEAMRR